MLEPEHPQKEHISWSEHLRSVGFVLAILASLLLPLPALKVFGPLAGIGVGIVCFFVYFSMRFHYSGIGGPLWLEMIDVLVFVASFGAVGISIFQGVRVLFSWIR